MKTVSDLRAAVAQATLEWDGMTWDSNLDIGDAIRDGRRVDFDEDLCYSSIPRSDIGHWRAISALRTSIEDEIDDDVSDETQEQIAAEADRLVAEESRYVTEQAGEAADLGARAVKAAEAGDLAEALRLAEQAEDIEHTFGDAPAWRPVRRIVESMVAAASAEDDRCEHPRLSSDGACTECGDGCSLGAEQDGVCYDTDCPLHGAE